MIKPFQNVETVRPPRSVFDLSYSKTMSADMGILYPIAVDEYVPGDFVSYAHSFTVRAMPLVAPILHQIDITVHTFFVPYRLLWNDEDGNWTDFISGGTDGEDDSVLPRMPYPTTFLGSLWDYFGFPENPGGAITATDTLPLDFPRRAYSFIWNEYFRDQNWQTEIDYLDVPSNDLLRRAWTKDYFSSCLPWAQRGVAPAFSLSGSAPLSGDSPVTGNVNWDVSQFPNGSVLDRKYPATSIQGSNLEIASADFTSVQTSLFNATAVTGTADNSSVYADMSSVSTFDVNTIRTSFQVQKWMERNARAGVRYTEFLRAQYGVSPRDERLNRPEYIGGMKAPLIVSEVLQTSKTDVNAPQGNMAGHGISVSGDRCGKYYVTEFGLVMSLMSIMPKPAYCQGIDRQWLRRTKFDFYNPLFCNLGEQAVEEAEIYWQNTDALNKTPFGFQARYDEMRVKNNMSVGMLRPGQDFDFWTLTRYFDSAPSLGTEFIECNPDNRPWAVKVSAPQFVVSVGNHIKAVRPIPALGTPGYIDHH